MVDPQISKSTCYVNITILKIFFFFLNRRYTCQNGLYALSWSCLLVQHTLSRCSSEMVESELPRLILTQAQLLSVIVATSEHKRATERAYHYLKIMWRNNPNIEESYANTLANTISDHPANEPMHHLVVCASFLVRYLTEAKRQDLLTKHKVQVDIYYSTI